MIKPGDFNIRRKHLIAGAQKSKIECFLRFLLFYDKFTKINTRATNTYRNSLIKCNLYTHYPEKDLQFACFANPDLQLTKLIFNSEIQTGCNLIIL